MRKAWSGTRLARALPSGRGVSPVAKYSAMRVVPASSVEWNCEVSMRMPRPVRLRTYSAVSSAMVFTIAPFQSSDDVPRENSGAPPGCPARW